MLACSDYSYRPPETEIVPLLLHGHLMDIKSLASDGMLLVSCCLAGHMCVWDAHIGDDLTSILRPGRRHHDSGAGNVLGAQESWQRLSDSRKKGQSGLGTALHYSTITGASAASLLWGSVRPHLFDQHQLLSIAAAPRANSA